MGIKYIRLCTQLIKFDKKYEAANVVATKIAIDGLVNLFDCDICSYCRYFSNLHASYAFFKPATTFGSGIEGIWYVRNSCIRNSFACGVSINQNAAFAWRQCCLMFFSQAISAFLVNYEYAVFVYLDMCDFLDNWCKYCSLFNKSIESYYKASVSRKGACYS
ncbi:hypothetical protein CKO29_17680 [Allochromatium vinosum]|nr:hypothetical protein [Allochromatium vinosum]